MVRFERWSVQFQVNGTIEVTRSDDTECVVCKGRSYDGNNDSNNEDVPVWIELIGISFGCVRWHGGIRIRPLARFRKGNMVSSYGFVIPDRRLGHR